MEQVSIQVNGEATLLFSEVGFLGEAEIEGKMPSLCVGF
jgi:hypothetical protein